MSRAAARRPLKTRGRGWSRALAGWLAGRRVSPNAISLASVVASALAAICFLLVPGRSTTARIVLLLVASAMIQTRLLANMLDGLVAIEGGLKSKTGDLYNEIPDRVDDLLILVAAGYALPPEQGLSLLGWMAAAGALLTAYVRLLAGSLGLTQSFVGPMAKPHRMFVLTLACLLSAGEVLAGYHGYAMRVALVVIVAGCIVTLIRRVRLMRDELLAR